MAKDSDHWRLSTAKIMPNGELELNLCQATPLGHRSRHQTIYVKVNAKDWERLATFAADYKETKRLEEIMEEELRPLREEQRLERERLEGESQKRAAQEREERDRRFEAEVNERKKELLKKLELHATDPHLNHYLKPYE